MKPRKRQLTTKTKKPPTERIIKDIRSLRDSGKTDIEIRETLELSCVYSNATLRPFMNKINKFGMISVLRK